MHFRRLRHGWADIGNSSGRTHPEHSLPRLHGRHRRRKDLPPDQSDRQSRLHACDESELGRLALGIGLCPEVPARAYLGAFLQHPFLCHRHLDQFSDEEEEASGIEEEGRLTYALVTMMADDIPSTMAMMDEAMGAAMGAANPAEPTTRGLDIRNVTNGWCI